MRHSTKTAMITALATLACAGKPPPVDVVGSPESTSALAGRWEGDYYSGETGRSGLIIFELDAQRDSAFGEVLMIPAGSNEPLRPYDRDAGAEAPGWYRGSLQPELLTIAIVRVGAGRVTGTLAPYRDPECGCELLTIFEGRLEGDVIEGTFTSRHGESGAIRTGRWKVERKDSPSDRSG